MPPARFEHRYRLRLLGWLLEGHGVLREALLRAWPRGIERYLVVNERIAEIPFVLRNLRLPQGSRVLDVGSRWSLLPLYLTHLGYRVVATDIAPVPGAGAGPTFVRADMRRPPFRPATFDGATMVSTLEHVGIGFYDPALGSDDDLALMRELRTLVRPGGSLLLTVPFGRSGVGPLQRSYDGSRLRRITEGWTWEESRFLLRRGHAWQDVGEAEAASADSAFETRAVALLHLRRA